MEQFSRGGDAFYHKGHRNLKKNTLWTRTKASSQDSINPKMQNQAKEGISQKVGSASNVLENGKR